MFVGMNRIFIIVVSILLLFLVSGGFYISHKNQVLQTRIDTLSNHLQKVAIRDSLTLSEIGQQQFKEDYYIVQLDRDTNLLLWLIPVLLAVFGFVSWVNVSNLVKTVRLENDNKYAAQEERYVDIFKKFHGLKADYDADRANKNESDAIFHFERGNYDWYVHNMLSSVKYISDYYLWFKEQDAELAKILIQDKIRTLQNVYDNIKDRKDIDDISSHSTMAYIKDIRRFDNPQIEKLLSLIHSKLKKQS